MSLEVHHLHLSQSERIVWLFEELRLEYKLVVHERDPQSALAPKSLTDINPFGTAPLFRDTRVSPAVELSESGAIVEYVLTVYGNSPGSGAARLVRTPDDADYGPYLQWLHFANGSLQPAMSRGMTLALAGVDSDENPITAIFRARTGAMLGKIDQRLAGSRFLAGPQLSAADIMSVFSLTTGRGFYPRVDLGPYKNILRYLKDVADRPAYKEALRKGDGGMEPMIAPKVKGFVQFPMFKQLYGDE